MEFMYLDRVCKRVTERDGRSSVGVIVGSTWPRRSGGPPVSSSTDWTGRRSGSPLRTERREKARIDNEGNLLDKVR